MTEKSCLSLYSDYTMKLAQDILDSLYLLGVAEKKGAVGRQLFADYAVLDGDLTLTVPPKVQTEKKLERQRDCEMDTEENKQRNRQLFQTIKVETDRERERKRQTVENLQTHTYRVTVSE